ncbi:MAG: ribulokinase [Planctomycetota bacterium]
MPDSPVALGLDFGTLSVRAVLIDRDGCELAVASADYRHGQIVDHLPGDAKPLPDLFALQHPGDWLESASIATRQAIEDSNLDADRTIGIGVDFTSCTMLPCLRDGTPLCNLDQFARVPWAWPKLWKHHAAGPQTDAMNAIARQREEPFLDRYGGAIGLEWFFPKMLETIEQAPEVADAADVWLEAGDWLVWRLVGCSAESLPRSTCQAGYKALWSAEDGYANKAYLDAVDVRLARAVATKMPGRMMSPGQQAGKLCKTMAESLGLHAGIGVSAATIDAHAGVPGVGEASAGTLVMVLGTSSCHLINSNTYHPIPGVAGIVEGGILPGLFGYETGQAAVGDAFAWLAHVLGRDCLDDLAAEAMSVPAGAEGVLCLDWFNGCRTPLMDGGLSGGFTGCTLSTTPAHLYRSLLEASAMGLRWIVELFDDGGVPVDKLVATGGLPHHLPAIIEIYADVLERPIEVHPSQQGPAVGAAVLGMFAAGTNQSGFETLAEAAATMASVPSHSKRIVQPRSANAETYRDVYRRYRTLAAHVASRQN